MAVYLTQQVDGLFLQRRKSNTMKESREKSKKEATQGQIGSHAMGGMTLG